MLNHIHIRNLAIVDTLELEFRPGMTVLTGETGAGKSILIDALGLSLGDRTDNDMIRPGCKRAEITASFDLSDHPELADWLREQAYDDGNECILRRVLVREGRSRSFINGSPAPLTLVQELGRQLVDIHGQHAHQSLLQRAMQRRLLDAYGGHQALVDQVGELHRRHKSTGARLDALRAAARDRTAKLELLRYQLGELDALKLGEGELVQLDRDHARLSNADRLQEVCARLLQELYEQEHALHGRLERAAGELQTVLTEDPELGEIGALLDSAAIQVQEAAAGLRSHLDGLEQDPALLQRLEERLGEIHDLARKYRVKPDRLPELQAELAEELDELENADEQLGQLEAEQEHLRGEYLAAARRLSGKRRSQAKRLATAVTEAMAGLGMPGGKLEVALSPRDEAEGAAHGLEDVELVVSANPGQPPQPLAKVASGGELSRISLAIQVITANCGQVPTLIFDEVDVGIGGGVAEIVGQLLRRLGADRQVLCVTHLPQVAAQGHHHLRVAKHSSRNQTQTQITPLEPEARVEEIARMLGGLRITDQTRGHAREMVAQAQR
jgi:DNA repair protein RecN (Recombination protein N)